MLSVREKVAGMNEPNRSDKAAKEATAGDDALRAADALLALGLNNDAGSRVYYVGVKP
jgi:hypothetical protein